MPSVSDDVEIALLRQRQDQDEMRIAALEKTVDAINKTVLTGKVGLVVLMGLGTFFGWLVSVGDKVKTWFH